MENQQERIEAMERLSDHVGEEVEIFYVDQFSKEVNLRGELMKVDPFSNIMIRYMQIVPESVQHWDIFKGRKIFQSTIGIPFLGCPDAIMVVFGKGGEKLYRNEHIKPGYNPHCYQQPDKNGRIREDWNLVSAFTKKMRKLSFGRKN